MASRLDRTQRAIPFVLSVIALGLALALLVREAASRTLPARADNLLGALSLALIAIAYLTYQMNMRPGLKELFKAALLSIAFLFWAANQLWSDKSFAMPLNNIAVGLFVLDVFLVIVGWPASSTDGSFAESCTSCSPCSCTCHHSQRLE